MNTVMDYESIFERYGGIMRTLQLFAQEEFLRKLERSRYAENRVLKGGMEAIMKEICQTDTQNDFIIMEVLRMREITQEKKYSGIGINLMARIKNVRIPFSVDIGVDDVIVPRAVKRTVTTRLEGLKEPSIYTYSLESTMAEKFDAILKRMTASSRMKDFSSVLVQIDRFIGPVYGALLREDEFLGMWSSKENVWK